MILLPVIQNWNKDQRTVPKYETMGLRFTLKGCKILKIQFYLFGGINHVSSTSIT
jgi:hypothetical protein